MDALEYDQSQLELVHQGTVHDYSGLKFAGVVAGRYCGYRQIDSSRPTVGHIRPLGGDSKNRQIDAESVFENSESATDMAEDSLCLYPGAADRGLSLHVTNYSNLTSYFATLSRTEENSNKAETIIKYKLKKKMQR